MSTPAKPDRRRRDLTLVDGIDRAARFPNTFHVPSDEAKAALGHGDHVKLAWEGEPGANGCAGERLWFEVLHIYRRGEHPPVYCVRAAESGVLVALDVGDVLDVRPWHVLDICTAADVAARQVSP